MTSEKQIHIINCHAEGEVGDVIVGGVAPPPGETLWEQRNHIAQDQQLRDYVLLEPRGGVFRHVNLLVPPKDKRAAVGFIIMEPEDTPPMSGSNSICVATVVAGAGLASDARAHHRADLRSSRRFGAGTGALRIGQGKAGIGAESAKLCRPAGGKPRSAESAHTAR